jgi:acyl-CoA thioesterase
VSSPALPSPDATAFSFAAATAVRPRGGGRYDGVCDPCWSAPQGPNGGYLAAIVLRALQDEVAEHTRAPRSLTCHFLRPPTAGAVRVEVVLERVGRSVTVLSTRLVQHDRPCVVALAAFARDFPSVLDYASAPPPVPAPAAVAPWTPFAGAPSVSRRVEVRPVFGDLPLSDAREAVTGGWLRLSEPEPPDPPAIAFYADAWLPAAFARLTAPVAAPTIDLTVHFRAPHAIAALPAQAPVLARFVSRTSAGGFFEEDGELWAPDGTLLAQSRQLALLVPARDGA